MGNISTKEVSKIEEALLEALDKLMEQGEPMMGFKSHYAFILTFCNIQWGIKDGYHQGIMTLDSTKFLEKNLGQRVNLLKNLLTDVISDVYINRQFHKS